MNINDIPEIDHHLIDPETFISALIPGAKYAMALDDVYSNDYERAKAVSAAYNALFETPYTLFAAILTQTHSIISKHGYLPDEMYVRVVEENDIWHQMVNECTNGVLGNIVQGRADLEKYL